jgi:hypothetical protein
MDSPGSYSVMQQAADALAGPPRYDSEPAIRPCLFTYAYCGNLMQAAQPPCGPCACCGAAQWCEAVLLPGAQERQVQSH